MTGLNDPLERARDGRPGDGALADTAADLAAELLARSLAARGRGERRQERQLAAMMGDAAGKAFTFAMADQVFRPPGAVRQARRFRDLLADYGAPAYLTPAARAAIRLGGMASEWMPALVMPQVADRLRRESSSVILPAERAPLSRHIARRRGEGMRLNLNQLGEAVLGEGEAARRLEANLDRLADPDCEHVSVKLSAVFSQIHPVGFEETLEVLKDRLRRLYRAALTHRRAGGSPKFVNLDMEEYRDLRLTRETFQAVLDEDEFLGLEAGIVLQAYLPDAAPVQRELNAWARGRVGRGGAGIRIRLVKGANLAMERVEAELHGWPLAPYGRKLDVDANFKRMLHEGCRPENAAAVRLGVASHNLFDLAYGLVLREREGVADRIDFEMLEGMANHQTRAVLEAAGDLLLYAPVVRREDFHSAIAYLVRRLDENTSPENFLHDLFGMEPGGPAWIRQRGKFLDACAAIPSTPEGPNRTQDRATENPRPTPLDEPFRNEPDTDFALEANVDWIRAEVGAMMRSAPEPVTLRIGGESVSVETWADASDPSRPGHVAYRYALAGRSEVERALTVAANARTGWRARGIDGRGAILCRAAAALAGIRGRAIATMALDAGKSVTEADTEVSEAVDFANYYARSLRDGPWFDGTEFEPFGTVVIAPPWNFPFAIPCGGALAALAAGATVILKPAPETVLTARVMVEALWSAGVPEEVLQFLPCPDDDTGRALVTDPRVDAVVLTGGHDTARMFLSWKPEMRLFAETSGKNALVITAAADPDLAVRDLVRSAFGHAGQKCSAASLAILEAGIHDDPDFLRKLKDAAASLAVGAPWSFGNLVTPLIRQPGEALRRALTTPDPGESWLLEPRMVDDNPCLWSPGIRMGVSPESWFRRTECFGPVLGIVRADDLEHALRIQNHSDFGLTGGIHSLDRAEIDFWRDHAEVGNAYINRPITGAIVRRQSFGGWKSSSFGPGAKAGGPNYVAQFGYWRDAGVPEIGSDPSDAVAALLEKIDDPALVAAAESDAWWMRYEFGMEHDPSGLACEANVFRYRPIGPSLLRAEAPESLARLVLAATSARTDFEISLPPSVEPPAWIGDLTFRSEDETRLARRLEPRSYGLLRVVGASAALKSAASAAGIRLADARPVRNGRIELLPYFREQAVSETRHRHGSVLPRPEDLS